MNMVRQWPNKISFGWVNSAQKRLGLCKSIVRMPTHYPPTMAQQNYFLLVQRCFKVVGPPLAHYWHANPPFPNGFHKLPTMAQLSVLLGYSIGIIFTGTVARYHGFNSSIMLLCMKVQFLFWHKLTDFYLIIMHFVLHNTRKKSRTLMLGQISFF